MYKSFPLIKAGCYLGTRWLIGKVVHKDRMPKSGRVIITPNHSSLVDGVLLTAYLNWHRLKPTHVVVQQESFQNKFFSYILKSGKSIPLDRSCPESIAKMFQLALGYLAQDEAVGIFPEGHLNNGDFMRLPRAGAVLLALESGAPILPVGLRGMNKIHSLGGKFDYKKRGDIYFGKLIDTTGMSKKYHQVDRQGRKELIASLSYRMMAQIAELSGLKLHRRMKPFL